MTTVQRRGSPRCRARSPPSTPRSTATASSAPCSRAREQADARADWTAHQVARDTLEAMLTKLGATPVAASPAYALPFAVTGAKSAKKLAATLEDGVTRAYLGLVAVSDPALRAFGAQAMQAAGEPRRSPGAAQPRLPRACPGLISS